MQIFNYNAATGEFLSVGEARESPLEPGIFPMPANATDIEPPTPGPDEAAVFRDGAWSIVPDLRQVAVWDTATGKPVAINSIGIAAADVGVTTIDPGAAPAKWSGKAWVADIGAISAAKIAAFKAAYDAAITVDVSYMSETFQTDLDSQNTLCKVLATVSAAGAVPSGFYWVATDNTQVPMNLAQLQGLAGAMLAQGWTAFRKLQTLKAAARAATTQAALDALTW